MKKVLLFSLFIITQLLFSNDNSVVKRYAILVGANNGGRERAILRYAESDAQMIANVFADIGGIEKKDSMLLLNPSVGSIQRAFDRVKQSVEESGNNTRTELIFYYSGHSNEEGLLIRESLYQYNNLKADLEATKADVRIGILDSCSSGAFTLLKGGKHSAAFLVDESVKTTGHAFITSSAEDESAQESNQLKASFFTHFLVSALRGAADTSLDGKVTLHEAYSYASNETLARTEVTQAGAQHASYDFRLSGSGDIVLTDLRSSEATIVLDKGDVGRFFIRDSEGNLISEVNKKHGTEQRISVPAYKYIVIKEVNGLYFKQDVELGINQTKNIKLNSYTKYDPEINVIRGDTNIEKATLDVPSATAVFGWSTRDKIRAANNQITLFNKAASLNGFQLSLANMVSNNANGVEIAPLFNIVGGNLSGVEVAGLFNIVGDSSSSYGVQVSGLFNTFGYGSSGSKTQVAGLLNIIGPGSTGSVVQVAGLGNVNGSYSKSGVTQVGGLWNISKDIRGAQVAGLWNVATDVKGAQVSGLWNVATDVKGGQITSIFNRSGNVKGAQISLINIAEYVDGTQIGLININKDIKGLPLGLINISTDGIQNLSLRYDITKQKYFADYQFGSSYIYYNLQAGINTYKDIPDMVDLGAGLGFHIPINRFYTEFDLNLNNKLGYATDEGFTYNTSNPVLKGKLGLRLFGDFAVFAGVSVEFQDILNSDGFIKNSIDNTKDITHSIFAGVRF